ncbi:2-hydroxyacid dehydrogenase [Acuticoccus sp. M5D2P5]|uniref:2-hydroxyacid dehydrogenase n=1 Tax=Acuticoccus kalidii TaxID=2910977 RepID=UPI001F3F5D5F|nr:2-hydroxyacid dehydrogenase [Acuticoccus kalidii]MCF3931949.1 2-hydroxyacid dehydrogenase [Acuticoccus kalidii]
MTEKVDVLIMNRLLPSCIEGLDAAFNTHKYFEASDKDAFLAEVGPKIRGVATSGHLGCPPEVMSRLPNLEMMASFGVGYDGIDVDAARKHGVRVSNTPDVLNDAMAEITLGLIIALCREIPQADVYTREGKWASKGNYRLTRELTGKTIGIIGLGRIGKEVARRCQAFKMQVVYHGRNKQEAEPYPYYADLTQMAKDVDWLVNIVPGDASTNKMINRTVFDALGPDGLFVNVGRGTTVDEAELLSALKEKRIGGAALDVFEDEPNVPEGFFGLDNVVLSPHQGSATHKTRWAMGDLVVRNLKAHFAGLPLISPVA